MKRIALGWMGGLGGLGLRWPLRDTPNLLFTIDYLLFRKLTSANLDPGLLGAL